MRKVYNETTNPDISTGSTRMFFIGLDPDSGAPIVYRFSHKSDGGPQAGLEGFQLEYLCKLTAPDAGGPFGPYCHWAPWLIERQVRPLDDDLHEQAVRVSVLDPRNPLITAPGGPPVKTCVLRRWCHADTPSLPFGKSAWTIHHEAIDARRPLPMFGPPKPEGMLSALARSLCQPIKWKCSTRTQPVFLR